MPFERYHLKVVRSANFATSACAAVMQRPLRSNSKAKTAIRVLRRR